MSFVIDEILGEIKNRCGADDYNYLSNFITVKLSGYSLIRQETKLVKYEMTQSEEWLKRFFITKKLQGLTDGSLNYYMSELKKCFSAINKPLNEITTDDIRYYLACMQLKGKVNLTTLDNTRRVLNTFFQYLEDEEFILKSPTRKIKKVRQEKLIKKAFSYEEIERIKQACDNKRDAALIEFMLSTGARVAEIAQLRKSDVDFDNNQIKVYGKGKKERIVYLNASSILKLRQYLESRADESEDLFVRFSKPHNGLKIGAIQKLVRDIGVIAGVDNVHPHRFRRTCATIAHKRGMSIEEISKMLGHADVKTTSIYIQIDDSEVKKSHEKYMN